MGIFTKLSTVIKSNINDLISKAENPEKMLNQIILDMRDQLAKAKREVAAAIADERKLKAQLETEGVASSPVDHGVTKSIYFTDPDGNPCALRSDDGFGQ